jgi:anti-sigma B factor antagonist
MIKKRRSRDMKIEAIIENDIGIIHISGKLIGSPETDDLHQSVDKCVRQGIKKVIVNLKEVEWMGSVGLGALMRDLVTVCHAGGELVVSSPSEKVRNLLKITKLNRVVKSYPDTQAAIQYFKNV